MVTRVYLFEKILIFTVCILLGSFLIVKHVYADTLTNAKNTLTTSRPSASSPLSANLGATDANAAVFDNGSFFLASDSAKVIRTSTLGIIDSATNVSSQSAALTTVYFGEAAGTAAQAGTDVLFVPITAMHTIQFTVIQAIPVNGNIIITFPTLTSGDADNDASPSATTFQFNNLVTGTGGRDNIDTFDDSSDISANVTITETEPSAGVGGSLSFNLDSGTIAAGSVVKIYLGCTSSTSSSCSTQIPRIINPTKSAAAGTADVWKMSIQTQDDGDVDLDNATVAVGTIESVTVRATVDPTLSFTITGIPNATAVNNGNSTGCSQTETTNAGIDASATEVNLGLLANTPAADAKVGNIAAQRINISTNGANGYTLTATSSGTLINPATGFFLESSTTPAAFPGDGSDWFGIHACGLDVDAATWVEGGSGTACDTEPNGSTATECFYGWPTQTSAITLASDTTGPIGNSVVAGNGITSVSYAAATDALIPPGEYRTIVTYVATPAF